MLVELAMGDAYGAGFEFCDHEFVKKHNTLEKYIQHPRHKSVKPGMYTDDTQMSIAIAEMIIAGGMWTKRRIAMHFLQTFKRDPRKGYSSSFQKFLEDTNNAGEFLFNIKPVSVKSGAAMRSCPIGIYEDKELIKLLAMHQASITHDTPDGIASSQAVALATHYFIYDIGNKDQLGKFLQEEVSFDKQLWEWDSWRGKAVGSRGMDIVSAAITAIKQSNSLSTLLLRCVNFTGDTDTVAAIALGIASNSNQIDNDLPSFLFKELEDDRYGRPYIENLDRRLMRLKGSCNY